MSLLTWQSQCSDYGTRWTCQNGLWRYQYNTEFGHDVNRVTYKPSQVVSRLIMGTASEGVRNMGNR